MSDLVIRARRSEDFVAGEEIVRHRLSSRVIHWSVALFFFVSLFSGMPIWLPIFGWMASLFGGLAVCRWLHPWAGVLFVFTSVLMFFHWFGSMKFEKNDADAGKYNRGQKLFFYFCAVGALLLLLSGLVLWFPTEVGQGLREAAILIHDAMFAVFAAAIVIHIYLGTAYEPGTFGSMIRGSVKKTWARFHHPRWYREVTGEEPRR